VVLDRALTDGEFGRDVLAGVTGQHELHDLALPQRQGRQMALSR
jgi:hypothetical protein